MFDLPNIRHLRAVALVARYQSVNGAAQVLRLSQPAVTLAIRQVESRCGSKLFNRFKTGTYPTAAGEALVLRIERCFAVLERGMVGEGEPGDEARDLACRVSSSQITVLATLFNLLDWQIFIEADGAKKLDEFTIGYVEDGTSVMHIPWVRETRTIHDVRVFPPSENGIPELDIQGGLADTTYFLVLMKIVFGQIVDLQQRADGYEFRVDYLDAETEEDRRAEVSFWFRDDKRVEMAIVWKALVYNGPGLFPEDLEDIVVPERVGNLQPPGPSNPRGAPYVFRICNKVRLDEVRRRQKEGVYDLLTAKDLEEISGHPKTAVPGDTAGGGLEEPKRQKDEIEGVQAVITDEAQKEYTVIEAYDRWDMDGDGRKHIYIFNRGRKGYSWILDRCYRIRRPRYPRIPRRPISTTSTSVCSSSPSRAFRWQGMRRVPRRSEKSHSSIPARLFI